MFDMYVCVGMKSMCVSCGRSNQGIRTASGEKEDGGGEGSDARRKDGWGDAVSSSAPTISFTFFCTSEARLCLRA